MPGGIDYGIFASARGEYFNDKEYNITTGYIRMIV